MSADQPTPPGRALDPGAAATVSADPGRPAPAPRPPADPGRVYADGELIADRYRVLGLLGRGGMGEVYEVHDRALDQRVALKALPLDRADAADRLDRELVLARRISHPGVCRLFDLGVDGRGRRFVTMERLHGETLAEHLARRGPLPPAEVATILGEVATALAAAHDAGVIHRDLKPHNLFRADPDRAGGEPRIVIMDFGLARRDGDERASVTDFAGTPAYMAPEQLTSRTVTTAVDIFALGVVVFELLTGELPFTGETPIATAVSRLQLAPPRLRDRGGPDDAGWDRLIRACLATAPARRPTAAEVPALRTAPPPVRSRRRWPRPAIALLVVGAGAAGLALAGRGARPAPTADPGARVRFAFALGGLGADNVNTLAWTADGDLIVGGHVAAGAHLAGHRLSAADAAADSAYVARTSRLGAVRWLWTAGGAGIVRVTGVALAPGGDVVAAGVYDHALALGDTVLPGPQGDMSGVVVRLDGATGALRWARPIDASRQVFLRAIAIDRDGGIYVGGEYGGTMELAGTHADAAGSRVDARSPMVAALAPSGEPRWLVAGRGAASAKVFGLAADGGRVLVSGMVWNPFELGGSAFATRPAGDAVIVALDGATGALRWRQVLQSTGPREASSADATAVAARDGRVVVAGNFQRGLIVGATQLASDGPMSAYVTELGASDGAPRWAFAIGGTGTSNPGALALTADGRAVIAGKLRGEVQVGATTVTSAGDEDALVVALDRDGRPRSVDRFGGAARDRARALAIGPDGLLAVGGMFAGTLDAGRFHLTGTGGGDAFVLELDLAAPDLATIGQWP